LELERVNEKVEKELESVFMDEEVDIFEDETETGLLS